MTFAWRRHNIVPISSTIHAGERNIPAAPGHDVTTAKVSGSIKRIPWREIMYELVRKGILPVAAALTLSISASGPVSAATAQDIFTALAAPTIDAGRYALSDY